MKATKPFIFHSLLFVFFGNFLLLTKLVNSSNQIPFMYVWTYVCVSKKSVEYVRI